MYKRQLENDGTVVEKCAIISPKRTHYKRVVEIISPTYLRRDLNVEDGAKFRIKVDLGDA